MTYRRPGIQVAQEFQDLQPALAPFNLPNCNIGAAYQVVFEDAVGIYEGSLAAYSYVSLNLGNVVDVALLNSEELLSAQFPVSMKLTNAKVSQIDARTSGDIDTSLMSFTDVTVDAFDGLIAGDIVEITTGNNLGRYIIEEVVNLNELKLKTPMIEEATSMDYRVLRNIAEVTLERDVHFTATEDQMEISGAILVDSKNVVEADVVAAYRALRTDLAGSILEYTSVKDIQAVFGVDQIVPTNPLAYGLYMGLQNTVTSVFGLGLGVEFATDESIAWAKSLDVLKRSEMYALSTLTQSPVVHQMFSQHVTQMSLPEKKKERAAIVNKKIAFKEVILLENTTSDVRVIVNTQTDGIVVSGADSLESPTSSFADVQVGDVVEVVSGTGAPVGRFAINAKDSDSVIHLEGFAATGAGNDVSFFIDRADGLEANGTNFYDTNAAFITSGVEVGHFLNIENGSFIGRYKIVQILSDKELVIEQVPGVISVQGPITYVIDRDMTLQDQAMYMAAYASSFANRRLVITFPDTVRVPVGSGIQALPGYYLNSAVAALTTGLPTHQGFTHMTVSGFLGFVNGSDRFDEDLLDVIAEGGVMIFDQEVEDAPLYVRHELTSDRSSIKFQEYQVTKNVDYIAKFIRSGLKDFIGVYNIVDSTFDELKSTSAALIIFLREDTVLPRIGGVIKKGSLVKLEEGTNIDTINVRFKLDIPIPLNNIDVVVQV